MSVHPIASSRPDPVALAKIHLAAAPVYYQNYLYGELFASQVDATLRARRDCVVASRVVREPS